MSNLKGQCSFLALSFKKKRNHDISIQLANTDPIKVELQTQSLKRS